MDAKWRLLDPWCRELRGVLEAVPATEESAPPQYRRGKRLEDAWELRVVLPRESGFTLRRRQTQQPDQQRHPKLQAIREALDLLWVVGRADEKTWTSILVHRCGVGGFDVPTWTDDARILPVLKLQPHHVDTIDDVVDVMDQVQFLMVGMKDEALRSEKFVATKQQLLAVLRGGGECGASTSQLPFCVSVNNWMSPRMLLSAEETNRMWSTLRSIVRGSIKWGLTPAALTTDASDCSDWRLHDLDLQLVRFVLTFEASLVLLETTQLGVRINEMWIDLYDRANDEFTASGVAAVLTKIFSTDARPQRLRVNCENATLTRLRTLPQLLSASGSPAAVHFERFGMCSDDGGHRTEQFRVLGECLAYRSMKTLALDIPDLCKSDVTAIAEKYSNPSEEATSLTSLTLTVDCHRESWPAASSLLALVGQSLTSLELGINGEILTEDVVESIAKSCPRLQQLKLHRLQLQSTNPFAAFLRWPNATLRALVLPRLHTPPHILTQLAATLAEPSRSGQLESLHLDLSELDAVGDSIVDDFTDAMRRNPYIVAFSLTLDGDAAAALSDQTHDDLYHLHNEVQRQPLRLPRKAAFLSVAHQLSRLPLALIFQFAAARTRRCFAIQEPSVVW